MSRRIVSTLVFAAGLLVGAGSMLAGLARADRLAEPRSEATVVLAQWLEAEHARADMLLERGDVQGAITALEQVRRGPWPAADTPPGPAYLGPVAVQLRHDLYGRLARLRLDHPDVDRISAEQLLATIDEGLAGGAADEPNAFTARLIGLRGEVLEELGRDDEALGAYEKAIELNRALLLRELGEAP